MTRCGAFDLVTAGPRGYIVQRPDLAIRRPMGVMTEDAMTPKSPAATRLAVSFAAAAVMTAGFVATPACAQTKRQQLYCGPVLRHSAEPIQAANFRSAVAF